MPLRNKMENHQWDTALDSEAVPLFLALQWAQTRSLREMRPLLARRGLTAAEFDVLATLRNAMPPHELTPSHIQNEVVITSGGLTKVMLQLEARQLVKRPQSASDLRIKPVRLTAEGKQIVEETMAEAVSGNGRWIRNALNPDEIRTLTRLLGKLAAERPGAANVSNHQTGSATMAMHTTPPAA